VRYVVFADGEFFLTQVGYVDAVAVGCNHGHRYEIGIRLQSLDILGFFRCLGLRWGCWLLRLGVLSKRGIKPSFEANCSRTACNERIA
jgi:hypothetical protein